MNDRPVVAFTLGDPGGIGPEVAVRAAVDRTLAKVARIVLVGDESVVKPALASVSVPLGRIELERVVEMGHVQPTPRVNERQGAASFAYLERASAMALGGAVDAIVTGPISKAAWHNAGHIYPGQTERLAELTKTSDVGMMLVADELRSILVTTHLSLAEMLGAISIRRVDQKIRLADRCLPRLIGRRPRLAVAAVNPHAGEAGAFGSEDETIMRPAVDAAKADGIDVSGPISGDAVFRLAAQGDYDAVVSAYHDQGLIPVKLMGAGRAVNVTLGLPFVRTSPDHGTAFDIAGTGIANVESAFEAVRLAAQMASRHDD